MKLMVLGATGAVGREVLELAARDGRFESIVAPTRRPLPARAGLVNPVWPMTLPLPEDAAWQVDALICCLGSTLRKAGSRAAFRQVDHDLVLAAAARARAGGARTCVLNSSLGADPQSGNFYLRTKGETERDLADIGFERLVYVRPSLIDAGREEVRPAEWLGIRVARVLRPLIPDRYKPVTPEKIAQTMLNAVDGLPGIYAIENQEILRG
ncbi:MAG: NAD-dependent dehydratase [Gammaproteobacteria bacterium]|nr:MAG: NAD-dependent dehydratase [Gammaproteobacteria bacterium]